MSIDVSCGCGFTLGRLDAAYEVKPNVGGKNDQIELTCPLCGIELAVVLQKLGVLARPGDKRVEYVRWGKPGSAIDRTVAIGRFRLELPNLGIMEPHQICYPRVPAFQTETGTAVPILPIQHGYFDCIDVGKVEMLRQQGGLGHVEGDDYVARLPLFGWDGEPPEVRLPLFTYAGATSDDNVIRDVNLRIWPNLPSTTWRHYLVGLSAIGAGATPILGPERRIRMFARGAATGFVELKIVQRAGDAMVGHLRERPTWIALELTDAGKITAGPARAGGLFEIAAVQPRSLGNKLNVGLDFGTSNTCLAFQLQGASEDDIELVPTVAETDWSLYRIRAGSEPTVHRGPDLWPARSGFGPSEDLFPSELLFLHTRGDQSQSLGDHTNWTYGVDFGIPVAGIEPEFPEADHIISEFKWGKLLQGSAFANHVGALQAHYLAATVMTALARCAARKNALPTSVEVFYSYPMAFIKEDHDVLVAAIGQVQQWLGEAVALSWTFTHGVSESEAAAQSNGGRDVVEVFLDMGGGSTDVAIRTQRAEGEDKWTNVYVMSMRYAGAALLAAYAGTRRSTCLAAGATVDQLRRKVRESISASNVVTDPRLFNPNRERARVNRTEHFYGYVVELAARMLAAGVIEGRFARTATVGSDETEDVIPVAVHLLGNGWRFKATTTTTEFKAALCSAIETRTENLINEYLRTDHPFAKARLDVLRTKTLVFEAGKPGKHVQHDKAAVAVGALKLRGRARAAEGTLPSGILGWTTTVRVAGVKRTLPWFLRYDNNDANNKKNRPSATTTERPVGKGKLGDPDTAPAADGPAAWYLPLGEAPTFDWQDGPPGLPRDLTPVGELDPNLSESLSKLRTGCVDSKPMWFSKGAFEVLLEDLFRDALREKIEG